MELTTEALFLEELAKDLVSEIDQGCLEFSLEEVIGGHCIFLVCDRNCKICFVRDLKFSKGLPIFRALLLYFILDWMQSSSFISSFTASDSNPSVGLDFTFFRIRDAAPL